MDEPIVDAVVVGGGPAGATAATDLARLGRRVVLLDRAGRIKPCGGAIPPRLIRDFAIPDELLVAKIRSARMVSPRDRAVDMPVGEGFVGMVDRGPFDEWLRVRAALAGAERMTGTYLRLSRAGDGPVTLHYRDAKGDEATIRTRLVIGADGANSAVGRQEIPAHARMRQVFAYHEIVRTPSNGAFSDEVASSKEMTKPKIECSRRAATSITRACSRRTSTPGSSRTATR